MDTRARLLFSGEATHTYFQKRGLSNDACTEMDTNDEEFANLLNEITLEMSPGDFTVAGDAVPFVAQHLTHTLVSLIEGGEVIEGGVFTPANFQ